MTALNCADGMCFAARSKSVTVVHRFGFSNGRLTVSRWESAGAIGTLDLTEQLSAVASRDLLEFERQLLYSWSFWSVVCVSLG
jgi:hypothetical protein